MTTLRLVLGLKEHSGLTFCLTRPLWSIGSLVCDETSFLLLLLRIGLKVTPSSYFDFCNSCFSRISLLERSLHFTI